jgi:exopolysaccharide biosynthesis predicted pyruvyltransferase EpsI
MLSAGAVVVTDRLHGHILCTLAEIPHVVVPDRHGKIRNYWDTWTHAVPFARWAPDASTALEIADALTGDIGSPN